MRCSAWSSRGIWASSALAALSFCAPAAAHVTVVPGFVEAGENVRVELDVPNERRDAMTGLTLSAPGHVEIVSAGAPAGWRVSGNAGQREWRGGRLPRGQTARFPVVLHARGAAGDVRLAAAQLYAEGASVRWNPTLTVLPATGEAAPKSHVGRALVAAAVGLLVVGGSLLVVRRLRRRPSPRS